MLAQELLGSQMTQLLLSRETAFEHRRGNQAQRHPQLHRIDDRPLSRPLLSGGIENLIDQIPTGFILVTQNIRSNLNQITAQLPFIPTGKNVRHLLVRQINEILHHPVSLGNQLHITVFDTVVNHLHKMSRPGRAYPLATGSSVRRFRRDALQDRLHFRPRFLRSSGHDGSTVQRTFLTARHSASYKQESFRFS